MEIKLNRKIFIILLKYMPWLIGLAYLLQIILSCFGVQSFVLTWIFGVSIVPVILLALMSISLGFCIWHRLPLYYTVSADFINIIDYYIGIPIPNMWMLTIYLILAGIFILIGVYVKQVH